MMYGIIQGFLFILDEIITDFFHSQLFYNSPWESWNWKICVLINMFLFQWGIHASLSLACCSRNSELFLADMLFKGCCNTVHVC